MVLGEVRVGALGAVEEEGCEGSDYQEPLAGRGRRGRLPSCFSFAAASLAYALGYFTPAARRNRPVTMPCTMLRTNEAVAVTMT